MVERFTGVLTSCLGLDKNSKESFLKKLQICMKIYDYKDESRDVKGKVRNITYLTFFRPKDSMLSKNCNKCYRTKRM